MYYYSVYLKNGEHLDFNKHCMRVLHNHETLCFFYNPSDQCLALIPYENIEYIILNEED